MYFLASLISIIAPSASLVRSVWLVKFFPLVFALGTFLTLAYYALDHFNAENHRRKEKHREKYPYVHVASHLEHGHALPCVLLHSVAMVFKTAELPSRYEVAVSVGGYMAFYLVLIHLNRALTGRWPYAVIDDVTAKGGALARTAFFALLVGLCFLLALGGLSILEARV